MLSTVDLHGKFWLLVRVYQSPHHLPWILDPGATSLCLFLVFRNSPQNLTPPWILSFPLNNAYTRGSFHPQNELFQSNPSLANPLPPRVLLKWKKKRKKKKRNRCGPRAPRGWRSVKLKMFGIWGCRIRFRVVRSQPAVLANSGQVLWRLCVDFTRNLSRGLL